MDIQRIVLFAGLAIVSYLMVLAWNEDYHQPQTEQVVQAETLSNGTQAADSMVLPESGSSSNSAEEFSTPETGGVASTNTTTNENVGDRFISVQTDVYNLKVDRIGGNIVESSLRDYDESLNS